MNLKDALLWLDENTDNTIEESTNDDVCLISRSKIDNKITLSCGHSFDYFHLFNELKIKYNKTFISCPYCRKSCGKFIPYMEIPEMAEYLGNKIFNSNTMVKCSYTLRGGKNKGKVCSKPGHYFVCGEYCLSHYKKISQNVPVSQCSKMLKNGKQCKCRSTSVALEKGINLCSRHYNKHLAVENET